MLAYYINLARKDCHWIVIRHRKFSFCFPFLDHYLLLFCSLVVSFCYCTDINTKTNICGQSGAWGWGIVSTTTTTFIRFPWLDVIADYNINYVKVKIKKEITLIIVNNINNSCNYMESFNYMESPNFLSGDNIRSPIV